MKKTIKRRNIRRRRGTQKGKGEFLSFLRKPKVTDSYLDSRVQLKHKKKPHSILQPKTDYLNSRLDPVIKHNRLHKKTNIYVGIPDLVNSL